MMQTSSSAAGTSDEAVLIRQAQHIALLEARLDDQSALLSKLMEHVTQREKDFQKFHTLMASIVNDKKKSDLEIDAVILVQL